MAEIVLFTGYSLLAVIAVLGAVASHRAADRAQHETNRVRESRSRLVALEHAVEALHDKFRRLAGRVYQRERPAPPPPDPADELPLEEKNALIRQRLRAEYGLKQTAAKPNGATE